MGEPRQRWIPYAVVALLAAAVYVRTLSFGFIFDDEHLIVNNGFLREAWSPARAFAHDFWYGSPFGEGYYRPLVVASLALNGRIFGWGPAGFHLVNVLLHVLISVLVLVLAKRIGLPDLAAALAASFFAVHPAAAWPVASIVARVDLLPTLFVLLAWIAYESSPAAKPIGRALLTGLFFLMALLCKESAIAFIVIPLLGLRVGGEPTGARLPGDRKAPIRTGNAALPSVVASLAAILVGFGLRRLAGVPLRISTALISPLANPLAELPGVSRCYAALRLSGRYLLYLLAPYRFADPADYRLPGQGLSGAGLEAVLSSLLLMAWAAGVVYLWLRRDRIGIALAFSLGSFLPASNLLMPIGSLYAQNFLYMPLLGLSLAVGDLLARWLASNEKTAPEAIPARSAADSVGIAGRRGRILLGIAGPLLALLAVASFRESGIWSDPLTLFSAFTDRFPNYAMAQGRLGLALLDQGSLAAAESTLRKALAMDDRNAEAHYNLAIALTTAGQSSDRLEEALRENRAAIALMPDLIQPRVNASKVLLLLRRPAEAEAEAREALRLSPGFPPARMNLAESLFRQSRYAEAATEFRDLARDNPGDPNVRSPYVVSLIHTGRIDEARAEVDAARKDFPDVAYFDFCLARVEARSGHKNEALALLRKSLERDPLTRDWIGEVDDFKSYGSDPLFSQIVRRPDR